MTRALYAGSFDPITRGHLNIIGQALQVFDEVYVAIGNNPAKTRAFPLVYAVQQIYSSLEEHFSEDLIKRITVTGFQNSLVEAAQQFECTAVVRGLRQVSDFNDEFRINGMMAKTTLIPMVYLICKPDFLHVASSSAKELASLKLDTSWLVTPSVEQDLKDWANGILP